MAAAAIPIATTALSALAGLFGNRGQTRQQTSTQTTNQSGENLGNFNTTETPLYEPALGQIRDQILAMLQQRAQGATDLRGYTATGLQNINAGADAKRRAIENILASRGLSYSPAAVAPLARIESGRIGEAVNFQNQIPLLQRQLQGEDLSNFANFFKSLPISYARSGDQ